MSLTKSTIDPLSNMFTCVCCGRNMEVRINGKFCNECAGYRSSLKRVLTQIINDLPATRDWLDPVLEREARELIGVQR